jgi:twitching motility protein PilT
MMMNARIRSLLARLVVRRGSDLHMRTGELPHLRIDGALHPVEDGLAVSWDGMQDILASILTPAQQHRLDEARALDLALEEPELGRFRIHAFYQKGMLGLVARTIPEGIPCLRELGVPRAIPPLIQRPHGMLLVTGPTGSGKSTTLAALLGHLNRTRRGHIVTLEDPVEFIHAPAKCVVSQREVGSDVPSFAAGMRDALRQDPDILMVGEMRDTETMSAALSLAETGHLVLSTLHTNAASEAVIRMVQSFPAHAQDQVRSRVAFSLLGVMTQMLVPRASGMGRTLVAEVMVCIPAIRALIREDRIHQIPSAIQTGRRWGMELRDDALRRCVRSGEVTLEEAQRHAQDPEGFWTGETS